MTRKSPKNKFFQEILREALISKYIQLLIWPYIFIKNKGLDPYVVKIVEQGEEGFRDLKKLER